MCTLAINIVQTLNTYGFWVIYIYIYIVRTLNTSGFWVIYIYIVRTLNTSGFWVLYIQCSYVKYIWFWVLYIYCSYVKYIWVLGSIYTTITSRNIVLNALIVFYFQIGKMCNYSKQKTAKEIIFVFFILAWAFTRLGVYPYT